MAQRRLLRGQTLLSLISAIVIVFSVLLVPVPAEAATCTRSMVAASGCTGAQARSGSVDIWGSLFRRVTPAPVVRRVSPPAYRAPAYRAPVRNVYRAPIRPAPAPAPVSITQDDLASFSPHTPSISAQPLGWSVVALPTNFIASSSQHSVSGPLLGETVEVRFTPVRFEWSYGDGAAASTTSSGATWQQLGHAEFSPTSTSHAYSQAGTFSASVTVLFTVEYRWAGEPWQSIPGEVSSTSAPVSLRVSTAQTVLVTGPCGNNRSSRGC